MNSSHNHIIEQVPVDYYQNGVKNNFLQRTWHTNKLSTVMQLVSFYPSSILDVGCASGWFLSQLQKKYPKAKCVGVDVYDEAIVYGKKKYPKMKFLAADAHALPFDKESFDLIVCTEVLEHVDDPERALKEIKRVLKKDGRAVVELDSGSALFSIVWYVWRKINGKVWNDSHLHSFNPKKLERSIKKVGMTIEEKKTFNFGMAMVFMVKK